MEFLGQNTGVGSLSLLQGNLPNPGIEPRSPALQAGSLPAEPSGKPHVSTTILNSSGTLHDASLPTLVAPDNHAKHKPDLGHG